MDIVDDDVDEDGDYVDEDDDDGDEDDAVDVDEDDDSRWIESGDNDAGPYEVHDDYDGECVADVAAIGGDEEEDEEEEEEDDGDGEDDDDDDLELEDEGDDDDSIEDVDDNTLMTEADVGGILNTHPLSVAPLGGDCEAQSVTLHRAPAYECVLNVSATSDGMEEAVDVSLAAWRAAGWLSAVTRSPQDRVSSSAGVAIDSSDDLIEMGSPYRAIQSQSSEDSAVSRAAFQLLSSPLRFLSTGMMMEEGDGGYDGGGTTIGGAQEVFNAGLDDYFTAPNRIETGPVV